MEMVVDKEKSILREELLNKLLSKTLDELKRRSRNVEDKLSELLIYKRAECIMVYYPLRGEVDVLEAVRKVKNKRFCFPVMDLEEKNLTPFEVNNLEEDFIREASFGVMQPDIKKSKEVDLGEIDIVIVPGLAFDYKKNRLGRGGGFYDRFLKRIKPPIKKVGVAFDFQIFEYLPIHLPQDERVDFVVSENRII